MPESSSGNIQLNPIPTQVEPLPLEGSGPVLGVRPPEEQGKTLFTPDLSPATLPPAPQSEQERGMIRPAWLAAAGFAILAIALWLLSILLKQRI